mgnify:CR=1 FL=1
MAKLTNCATAFALINRYDKGGEVNVGHDAIYAGGAKAHPEKMEPLDRAALKRLGWRWDDDTETWVKFV